MLNAISVDVEEYFHATNLEACAPPRRWHALPSRVEESTEKVLDIFQKCKTRGTFFILGYVARRHPELVRRIAAAGHEIASHGYGHQIALRQSPRVFYRDVYRSKRLLEDLAGTEVSGYRAPSFSINDTNLWAYDALIRAGYRYDSSLYPTYHPLYGNPHRELMPTIITRDSGELVEFPMAVSTFSLAGYEFRLPVAGGAYWRFLPLGMLRYCLTRINDKNHRASTCYFHPWELDPLQPYFSELPLLKRARHYTGVASFSARLEQLLNSLTFGPVRDSGRELLERQRGGSTC